MIIITTEEELASAVLDPPTRALLDKRCRELLADGLALSEIVSWIVVAPGDALDDIERAIGLATKLQLTDDAGIHTLVPGQKGFKPSDLSRTMLQAAKEQTAQGILIIIDTIKKFVSLMDKKEVAAFAEACRQLVLAGGTVLAFGHTAKHGNAEGKLRYAGVTDLLDDFDAAFIMTPIEDKGDSGERIIEFTNMKRRGNSPDRVV